MCTVNVNVNVNTHTLTKETENCSNASQKSGILTSEELNNHIEKCALNNRESQKKIYTLFYDFALVICNRYANSHDDAIEIINDSFLKIFKEIHRFKPAYTDVTSSFRGWLRKIIVYTAIDHFRRNHKHQFTRDIDNGIMQVSAGNDDSLDRIFYKEIIKLVQELSPGYRTVLNLFIIEGFTHKEISKQLGISIGTSKSNLAKARGQLKKILFQQNHLQFKENHDLSRAAYESGG